MWYAGLHAELLAARDTRQMLLEAVQRVVPDTVIFVSTAVPGTCKTPPGSGRLFHWALTRLRARLRGLQLVCESSDPLGPYAMLTLKRPARAVKRACIAIEDTVPAARLLDLDVYAPGHRRLGRVEAGWPARHCLLCEEPAVDCIRLQRHSLHTVVARAHALLRSELPSDAG